MAIINNNAEMVDILMDYALKHDITLKIDEKDIETRILQQYSEHTIRKYLILI